MALTALVGSLRKAPSFVATCDVLFQATAYDPTDPTARPVETIGTLQSNAEIITTPEMALRAAAIAKLPVEQVGGKINVEIPNNTQIFRLRVVDAEQLRAGAICNAYAEAYSQFKLEEAKKEYERLLAQIDVAQRETTKELLAIEAQLEEAERRGQENRVRDYAVQRDSLLFERRDRTIQKAQISNFLKSGINGGGQLIKPAYGGQKVGGNWRRDLMMGALVGLMFGFGIALVREYLDDTVKDKDSTQRELGIPVLATLPDELYDGGYMESDSPAVEAARQLRATLASLGFPHEKNMLVITSTLSKSRATTLAALAAAVAESGRTVLVIGSDLRNGRTHEAFGVANTVGLANVVRGQAPLERAVRPAPGLDGVYVLPCGPIIGNPGELLSSEEMAFVLRRARRWADVVLLDAPPVLAAADASVLGAYADGVLLVVSAGQTNRGQANEAKEQLVAAGARVLGAVLVGSDEASQRNGNGGNGYGLDLPQLVPYGSWDSYEPEGGYDWWGDEVVTATARTMPRTGQRRSRPPKKISAASTKAKPTRPKAEQAIRKPTNGRARATSKSTRAASTRAASTRSASTRSASNAKRTASAPKRTTGTARTRGTTTRRSR